MTRPEDDDDLAALLADGGTGLTADGGMGLTADDVRRIRHAEALTRAAQQDFQRLRTRTVGLALTGRPLNISDRALIAHGGGPASSQQLWSMGLLR